MFIGIYLIMVNDPQILFNDGFYPLLHVVMPEGSLLRPRFPSALGCRTHALARLFDVLGGALCKNAPELNTASGYGTSPYMLYSGWDRQGEFFYSMEILYGGIPGRPIGDGMDGHSWWPLFENIPTEYLEAYYPMRIDGYTTVTDSGGAGFHRGGNGVEKRYVYLETGEVSIHDDRWLTRPWGVLGGWPGRPLVEAARAHRRHARRSLPSKCDNVARRARRHARLPHRRRRRLEGPARPAGRGGRTRRLVRARQPRVREGGLRRRARRRRGGRRGRDRGRAGAPARGARRRARVRLRPAARRAARRRARPRPGSSRRCRRRRFAGRRSSRATRRSRACARATGSRRPADREWRREFAGLPRARRLRPAPRPARRSTSTAGSPTRRRRSCATSTTWSRRSAGCSTRRSGQRPGCPSSSRPSPSTRRRSRRRRSFIDKVPALLALEAGSPWIEIDPRIGPEAGEAVLVKSFASAFFGTALCQHPRRGRVRHGRRDGRVDVRVRRATAVDALQHGYRVAVPREAVGDRNQAAHEANLYDIDTKYADVVSLDEVVATWRRSPCPRPLSSLMSVVPLALVVGGWIGVILGIIDLRRVDPDARRRDRPERPHGRSEGARNRSSKSSAR